MGYKAPQQARPSCRCGVAPRCVALVLALHRPCPCSAPTGGLACVATPLPLNYQMQAAPAMQLALTAHPPTASVSRAWQGGHAPGWQHRSTCSGGGRGRRAWPGLWRRQVQVWTGCLLCEQELRLCAGNCAALVCACRCRTDASCHFRIYLFWLCKLTQPDPRPACRCPGRYFAEAELALIASLLLLLFDWRLLPRDEAAEQAASKAQQRTAGSAGTAGGTAAAAAGSGAAAAEAASSIAPGDPAGLLPPPDLRKLVGIKVPAGPCWVQYQRRQLAA